ncbi:hypothetical protein B0H14DRAFT_2953361, partial [Mycena olivaceomarginata]
MFLAATLVFARFPLTVSPEMLWLTFCKICLSQLALRVFILQENAHTAVLITNPLAGYRPRSRSPFSPLYSNR